MQPWIASPPRTTDTTRISLRKAISLALRYYKVLSGYGAPGVRVLANRTVKKHPQPSRDAPPARRSACRARFQLPGAGTLPSTRFYVLAYPEHKGSCLMAAHTWPMWNNRNASCRWCKPFWLLSPQTPTTFPQRRPCFQENAPLASGLHASNLANGLSTHYNRCIPQGTFQASCRSLTITVIIYYPESNQPRQLYEHA